MSNEVQYQFALNREGQSIDIADLSTENKSLHSPFKCIGCNNDMVPVLNVKTGKQKYFRHKSICDCSKETYLHNFSKKKFYENYSSRLNEGKPFFITTPYIGVCDKHKNELGFVCERDVFYEDVDITQFYDLVFLEKRTDKGFIADILLSSSKGLVDDLLVEIAVTHYCSNEKKSSGSKIIELKIEGEKDILEYLDFIRIPQYQNKAIRYYNLKTLKRKRELCEGSCAHYVYPVYILTIDGFIRSRDFTPEEASSDFGVDGVALWQMFQAQESHEEEYEDWINEDKFNDDWDNIHAFTREIINNNLFTKSCSACKHHRKPYNEHQRVYCMKKKRGLYDLHQDDCKEFKRFTDTRDFDGFCRYFKSLS